MRCTLKLALTCMTLCLALPVMAHGPYGRWRRYEASPRVAPRWEYRPSPPRAYHRHGRMMAFIPGDPHRAYCYDDGAWVLRRLERPRYDYHCEPVVQPPPLPLPRIGLSLHWVLN